MYCLFLWQATVVCGRCLSVGCLLAENGRSARDVAVAFDTSICRTQFLYLQYVVGTNTIEIFLAGNVECRVLIEWFASQRFNCR
jgi:hypothetical protein